MSNNFSLNTLGNGKKKEKKRENEIRTSGGTRGKVLSKEPPTERSTLPISPDQLASSLCTTASVLSVLSLRHDSLLIPKFLRDRSQSRFRATSFHGLLLSRKFPDFRATARQPPNLRRVSVQEPARRAQTAIARRWLERKYLPFCIEFEYRQVYHILDIIFIYICGRISSKYFISAYF